MSAQTLSCTAATRTPVRLPGAGRPDTIENLELRLVDGYHRIDLARNRGEEVTAWEDFWIELLHRYEALCDGVRVAA